MTESHQTRPRRRLHPKLTRQIEAVGSLDGATLSALRPLLQAVDASYRAAERDSARLRRDLKAAEAKLKQSEGLLLSTLEATADGILTLDNDRNILLANSRFFEIWGMPRHLIEPENRTEYYEFVLSRLQKADDFVGRIHRIAGTTAESMDVLQLKDGRILERYSRALMKDGRIAGRVWSFRDITDRHELEQQLRRLALRDPLTQLHNRMHLFERMEQAIEHGRLHGGSVIVMFMDLDDFKEVNDAFGHAAGDQILQTVARRITDALRAVDTAARLGGDEFAVLLGKGTREQALAVARSLLEVISQPIDWEASQVRVGASIGISEGSDAVTPEELLRQADTAMYAAKAQGKGRIRFYDDLFPSRLSA